jgi:hypothetical protein
MAAPTIKEKGNFLGIENITEDYTVPANVTNWEAVKFFPGAVGDKLVVKEQDDTGPVISELISYDGEGRIDRELGSSSTPFIDESACILSAGAKVCFIKKITS